MGNMCLDLCKEITASDRKARLTKEIKDIHPIDDGSLRIHANGSVFNSKLQNGSLLRESYRMNGEVTYKFSAKIDDESISELNELIREVSISEEMNEENTTKSSTSLEISTLLADLENHKYLHVEIEDSICGNNCLTPNSTYRELPRHSSPYIQYRRNGFQRLSDYNNNINPAEEVTYLLKLLEKDDRVSLCSHEESSSNFDTLETEHPYSSTDSGSDTDSFRFDTTDTSISEESITKQTIQFQSSDITKFEKKPPDPVYPSTVIDTYLKNIDETFTKEDEVEYLLSLLGNDGTPFTKSEKNTSEESIMHDSNVSNETIENSPSDKTYSDTNIFTTKDKETSIKETPVVRKISPVFSIQDKFIIPARKCKNLNKSPNKDNMDTVVNAMDFICQLICNSKAPPLVSKPVSRPLPPSPKKMEIQSLLSKLETNATNSSKVKVDASEDVTCTNTNIDREQNGQSYVNTSLKTKTIVNSVDSESKSSAYSESPVDVDKRNEKRKVSDNGVVSEETQLLNMMSNVTECHETEDVHVSPSISKELEIETLLSKLGNVQLIHRSNSSKEINGNDKNSNLDSYSKTHNGFVFGTNSDFDHLNGEKDLIHSDIANHDYTPGKRKLQSGEDVPYLLSLLDDDKESPDKKKDKCETLDVEKSSSLDERTNSLEKCNSINTQEQETKKAIITEEVDLSEISVTYRRIKKSIILNDDEFSEETKSIKNELHFYTRGLRCRSLSPCYEHDEIYSNNTDTLSLDQLIEQLASFEASKRR